MPELPEVETIARSLRNPRDLYYTSEAPLTQSPGIVGRKISGSEVLWDRSIATPNVQGFQEAVNDRVVLAVSRRGKYLVFELDKGWILLHLRMSGDIRVEPNDREVKLHDRVLLHFLDGMRLSFNDTRKFGRIWYLPTPGIILDKLGLEPFDPALDGATWYEKLICRKRQLKPLLLDQTFLAGLGNIYTDESLHRAGLHPLRRSETLSEKETEKLIAAIRDVLHEGIERNGASIDWVYRGGNFQNYFRVYQRDGAPCYICGTVIERILVGQRGTHYCPTCQPRFPGF